jgi:hypothetical protein
MSNTPLFRGWVKIKTQEIIGVPKGSNHGQLVFDNPGTFGLTVEDRDLILKTYPDDKDNNDHLKWLAMKNGWVRTFCCHYNVNGTFTIEGRTGIDLKKMAVVALSNMGVHALKTEGCPFSSDCLFEPLSNFNQIRFTVGVRHGPLRDDMSVYVLTEDDLMDYLSSNILRLSSKVPTFHTVLD